MSRFLLLMAAGLAALLLQSVLWPAVIMTLEKPDLLLLLTVFLAMIERPFRGGVAVFLLGSWYDIVAGSHPGLHGVVLLSVFWCMQLISLRFNNESAVLQMIMIGVATLLQAVLVIGGGFFAEAGGLWQPVVLALLPQLVLNVGVGYLLRLAILRLGLEQLLGMPRSDEA